VYYIEFHERIKTHLVPEIFKFEKCVKYANEMTDDVMHLTQILYQVYKWSYLGQFAAPTIETW